MSEIFLSMLVELVSLKWYQTWYNSDQTHLFYLLLGLWQIKLMDTWAHLKCTIIVTSSKVVLRTAYLYRIVCLFSNCFSNDNILFLFEVREKWYRTNVNMFKDLLSFYVKKSIMFDKWLFRKIFWTDVQIEGNFCII